MEITRTWTLSTAHISEKTAKWLDSHECTLGVIKYDYGWIVCVPERNYDMPKDLEILIDYARENNIDDIKLDSDGSIENFLKTYEWDD